MRESPPVPKLPFGELFDEGLAGWNRTEGWRLGAAGSSGLSLGTRHELEALGLDVFPRGSGPSMPAGPQVRAPPDAIVAPPHRTRRSRLLDPASMKGLVGIHKAILCLREAL